MKRYILHRWMTHTHSHREHEGTPLTRLHFWCNTPCSTSWTVETKSNPSCFALGVCVFILGRVSFFLSLLSSSSRNVSVCTVENTVYVRRCVSSLPISQPEKCFCKSFDDNRQYPCESDNPTKNWTNVTQRPNTCDDEEDEKKINNTSKVWKQKIWAVCL